MLGSFYSDEDVLDIDYNTIDQQTAASSYYFAGLFFTSTKIPTLGNYELKLTRNNNNAIQINYEAFLPSIESGYGEKSIKEGSDTTASGSRSHAEGYNTTASGNSSHAEGFSTKASGHYSHAECCATTASGDSSHAEGIGTTASGAGSHAEGTGTTASGYNSHAEGMGTTASWN